MTIEFPLDGGCKRQGAKLGFELIKLASGHNIYGYGSTRAVINRAVYTLHMREFAHNACKQTTYVMVDLGRAS